MEIKTNKCAVLKQLIIIAASANRFAASALKGGHKPWVFDFFGDRDTQQYCSHMEVLMPDSEGKVCLEKVLSTSISLPPIGQGHPRTQMGFLIGSGLEKSMQQLRHLTGFMSLIGNDLATTARCFDKQAALVLAEEAGLPCISDEIRGGRPFVLKPRHGSGGHGSTIEYIAAVTDKASWGNIRQEYWPGHVISHLFLSRGKGGIRHVGFSLLWNAHCQDAPPFAFGGAVTCESTELGLLDKLHAWSEAFAWKAGLLGLNNIDYIVCSNRVAFLECNPHPSATLALYDMLYPQGLVDAHIRICQDSSWTPPVDAPPDSKVRAFFNVYSPRTLRISKGFTFPQNAFNLPQIGTLVQASFPLCSVAASGKDTKTTLSRLQQDIREVIARSSSG